MQRISGVWRLGCLTVLLAAAAVHNGDRVGLTLVSDRIEAELPPAGGARHLARLLRLLVVSPTRSRRTNLTVGLKHLSRRFRRGLVVVLSDFLDVSTDAGPWRQVARRHEVVAPPGRSSEIRFAKSWQVALLW